MRVSTMAALLPLLGGTLACQKKQESVVELSADLGALREAFNGDRDHVRILMLVSPT